MQLTKEGAVHFFKHWCLVILLAAVPVASLADENNSNGRPIKGWSVQGFAQAGFSALRIAEQLQRPHMIMANGVYTVDPEHVELEGNNRYVITPALSSGIVFWNQGRGRMGVGIGVEAVYLFTKDETRVLPAVSLHVGELNSHVFLGALFAAVDRVEFPAGPTPVIVPSDGVPNFVTSRTGVGLQFYAGIVVLGKAVGPKQ